MKKNLIYLIKGSLLIIILLFIVSILINIFYYFDVINNNLINYLKMFLTITIFFVGGIYIGKKSESKGYINGLKLSLIIVLFFFTISIIFNNYKVSRIIYYLITTTCITFGSMIGINNNKENKN